MNYFVTDLDKTIIYPGYPEYKCVENKDGKPYTFMTEKAFEMLNEILEKAVFVPCTMRTIQQVDRIGFITSYKPKFMICVNGAEIYIDGKLDTKWDTYIRSKFKKDEVKLLCKKLKSLALKLEIKEIFNMANFYTYITFESIDKANLAFKEVKRICPSDYTVVVQEHKIFMIKECLNKAYALDYLKEKYNFEKIYASGDSYYDKMFTERDYVKSILPKHADFTIPNSLVTKEKGIKAGEEILEYVLNEIKK